MPTQIKDSSIGKGIFNFLNYAVEVVGWLQIVLSFLLLGLIIAVILYFTNPSSLRLIIAMAFGFVGLIVGIVVANRAWKNKGTIDLISKELASPELDILEEENVAKR